MKEFTKILLFTFLMLIGCARDQEPIFHLFDHSRYQPDYDEVAFLKSRDFKETRKGDTLLLSRAGSGVELTFIVYQNEIIEKLALIEMTRFDTLLATRLIERQFSGKKTTGWNNTFLANDSIYSTLVEFRDDFYVVTLDSLGGRILLKTRSDLFHRIVRD